MLGGWVHPSLYFPPMGVRIYVALIWRGFLLGIPISLAAIASQVPDVTTGGLQGGTAALFSIGFVSSAVTAYFSIKFLLAFFTRYSLRLFAYYVFIAAAVVARLLLLEA